MPTRSTSSPAHRLVQHGRTALDAYSVRISLGLILSLLCMLALTRLPVHTPPDRVGWGTDGGHERIQLTALTTQAPDEAPDRVRRQESDVLPTVHQRPQAAADEPSPEESPAPSSEAEPTRSARHAPLTAAQLTALGPAGQRPEIIGGRGSFYLSIEYPEEARRQGIQGRVVLDFLVDTEGRTQNVRVLKSLHPLCDSSAVAALRRTRFVPGRHNGQPVPVRMRLPVRFQLINLAAQNDPPGSPRPEPHRR